MRENKNTPWKAFLGCGGISLFFLVVVVLGITLACIATVAIPLLNHEVLQKIACPPGTTLVNGYCEDTEGNQTEVLDLGYGALEYFPIYFLFSLIASFFLTLLVVIPLFILYQFIKRKFFSKPSTSPYAADS